MDTYFRFRVPIIGKSKLPVDHGYFLFSSICKIVPELHGAKNIAFSPVEGGVLEGRTLIFQEGGYFWIQTPPEGAHIALRLAGKQLRLGEHVVRVGMPRIESIRESSMLFSRMVAVKGKMEGDQLEDYIRLQLVRLYSEYIGHNEEDMPQEVKDIHIQILRRRVMKIRDHKVVGFGVKLLGLSDRMSLLVQQHSLAGRRRFGAAFFTPVSY